MSKRETRRAEGISAAEAAEETVGMSLEDLARRGYGLPDTGLMSVGGDRMVAKPLGIFEIAPDPAQPRRVVPNVVRARARWNGSPETTQGLFEAWIEAFAEESGLNGGAAREVVRRLLDGKPLDEEAVYQDGSEAERHLGPITTTLLAVVDLGASIRRDGLINPITIYPVDPAAPPGQGGYRIETGERRWLAYHLLYTFTGEPKWNRIPAQVVNAPSVWKQAVENNARIELTAIGKARQLAILVMDLYRQSGTVFQPYQAFEHDRHYYAQVADGNVAYRIPAGKGEEIMQAMGLKSPKYLAQFRALLRLPDELWSQADDEGWAEGFIRERAKAIRQEFYSQPTSTIVEVPGEDELEESLRGFQVGDWIEAGLADHVLVGQIIGFDYEQDRLVVSSDKGTARIRPEGVTLLASPPPQPPTDFPTSEERGEMPASAPPDMPKQHPKPNTHTRYNHRIYEGWRSQFAEAAIVLIEYDGAFLALAWDDSLLRDHQRSLQAGGIGLSGSADYMLVTKIDLPFVRQLQKQRGRLITVRFDALDEDMQYVAGLAGRARKVPLNRLADLQPRDEAAEQAKAEREAREEESRLLLNEWRETLRQWEAQAKDFKARAEALRLKEAGVAATETQRFSSFLSGFKAWLERKR